MQNEDPIEISTSDGGRENTPLITSGPALELGAPGA